MPGNMLCLHPSPDRGTNGRTNSHSHKFAFSGTHRGSDHSTHGKSDRQPLSGSESSTICYAHCGTVGIADNNTDCDAVGSPD